MNQPRALCIPPAVLALPVISWPARLVLAEVLALHKAQGSVWAQDEYFVARCLLSKRTVGAAIKELVDAGLLTRRTKQSAQRKRTLTPTLPVSEPAESIADAATGTPDLLQDSPQPIADSATTYSESRHNLLQISPQPIADSATIIIELIKEENKSSECAASSSSFLNEEPKKNSKAASRRKSAARADEVAALPLPHPGAEFADLWATFRTMPKQVKKPVSALHRLLATLGKYAEAFACQMLDKAIQGAWSGVEFDGTAKAYADWQAAQAEAARRQPVRTPSPPADGPLLNTDFLAQQQAREQQALADQNDEWHRTHNTDALFGYTQTAAEGLAQSRQGPDWERYLAEQAGQPPPDAASAA